MAKDRLKRRIAEALQGSSVRDALKLILAGDDEARPDAGHGAAHSILDDVKDPILTVAADGIVHEANAAAVRLLRAPVTGLTMWWKPSTLRTRLSRPLLYPRRN